MILGELTRTQVSSLPLRLALVACSTSAAFLLIVVQPALTLALLPSTGGHPLLWAATQSVFQALLVVGYLVPRFTSKTGYTIVLISSALATAAFPVDNYSAAGAPAASTPAQAIITVVRLVGPGFIALSTVSMWMQKLAMDALHDDNPYWLYAFSNSGSLGALLAYPFLIEPMIPIAGQLHLWSIATLGVLLIVAVMNMWHAQRIPSTSATSQGSTATSQRVSWLLGGMIPVGVSLSCTSYLQLGAGTHPVVWVAPFALYLLSLIIVFSDACQWTIPVARWVVVPASLLMIVDLRNALPLGHVYWSYLLHLTGLCSILLLWHDWLHNRRPKPGGLLDFYALVATGGATAGAFLTLGVPGLFNPQSLGGTTTALYRGLLSSLAPEYILLLILSAAVLGVSSHAGGRSTVSQAFLGLIVAIALLVLFRTVGGMQHAAGWEVLGALSCLAGGVAAATWLTTRARWTVSLITVTAFSAAAAAPDYRVVEHSRTPFGHLRVVESGRSRVLLHGDTLHGLQPVGCTDARPPESCGKPTSYYYEDGPVGRLYRLVSQAEGRVRSAVVGVGVGTMSLYCGRGDAMRFWEIDPTVTELAGRRFTFLSRAQARCGQLTISHGDARLLLREQPAQTLELIVMDAFSADAVPVHLITAESIREFAGALTPSGYLAIHTSSHLYRLTRVVRDTALAAGLFAFGVADQGRPDVFGQPSAWVIVASNPARLEEAKRALGNQNARILDTLGDGRLIVLLDQNHSLLRALR